ncbi:MAG: hypothetical protein RSC28_01650 [Bacteroidales bacterium]
MKRYRVFLVAVLCFASIFINRSAGLLSPLTEIVLNTDTISSTLSIPITSNLADIAQHASYDVPYSYLLESGERTINGNQRRTQLAERSMRFYGKQLLDFSFLQAKTKWLSVKNDILKLASGGICLNALNSADFFIFTLRKMRV